jgi:hypothetical protein
LFGTISGVSDMSSGVVTVVPSDAKIISDSTATGWSTNASNVYTAACHRPLTTISSRLS